MRRPPNSILNDTTEKPYNNESYQGMKKTATNKEVEDAGGTTKHSEFEKPYRLNSLDGSYQDMQNFHPSNYDFSFLFPGSPNWENLVNEEIGGGGGKRIGGIGGGGIGRGKNQDCMDDCKNSNNFIACYCCCALHLVGMLSFINCNSMSMAEAETVKTWCFESEGGGSPCGDNSISGPDEVIEGSQFTIGNNSNAYYTASIDKGNVSVSGNVVTISNISSQCGIVNLTITDICGNTITKQIRMPNGSWYISGQDSVENCVQWSNVVCKAVKDSLGRWYELSYGENSTVCSETSGISMTKYSFTIGNQASSIDCPCPDAPCGTYPGYTVKTYYTWGC